jgi:hypothetical protein
MRIYVPGMARISATPGFFSSEFTEVHNREHQKAKQLFNRPLSIIFAFIILLSSVLALRFLCAAALIQKVDAKLLGAHVHGAGSQNKENTVVLLKRLDYILGNIYRFNIVRTIFTSIMHQFIIKHIKNIARWFSRMLIFANIRSSKMEVAAPCPPG